MRLDQYLCDHALCESRQRAQALILAGAVQVNGEVVRKAGAQVKPGAQVAVREGAQPYVSRGGLKLRHALSHFAVDVRGASALDVGASTGGFTDCLLQAGAARVCAVDVGYGQLAWKLRSDPRVSVMDRVNARHLDPAALPFRPDIAVCDVSFISQTLILPRLSQALVPGGTIITLVKPQFEVGRELVCKGGVVRDPAARQFAVSRCQQSAVELGLSVVGAVPSPILGPAGNEEYLLCLRSSVVAL